MSESAWAKGMRLLASGRLIVQRVDPGGLIVATCRGDSGIVYNLGFDGKEWRCTCPARGRCAHLWALQTVTVRESASIGSPRAEKRPVLA